MPLILSGYGSYLIGISNCARGSGRNRMDPIYPILRIRHRLLCFTYYIYPVTKPKPTWEKTADTCTSSLWYF